tara:strand:+ start:210 stop:590 length:381 start_codon:yes stop_codon:yes gene_type:complete
MLRATAYFAIVFAAGFVLGVVRVLWLVPLVGERSAELLEMPLMLAAIVVSARFVTRRFPASRQGELLISGAIALALMLAVEFSVVLGLRGLSVREYVAERDPVAGTFYLIMLGVFALMPWVIGRKS